MARVLPPLNGDPFDRRFRVWDTVPQFMREQDYPHCPHCFDDDEDAECRCDDEWPLRPGWLEIKARHCYDVKGAALTLDTPLATFDVILRRKAAGQGLGLQLEVMEPSGFIVVDGVLPGGIAAEHGGIAVGDVLISVGADKVVNKSFDTVRTLLQKAAPLMELPLVFGRRA